MRVFYALSIPNHIKDWLSGFASAVGWQLSAEPHSAWRPEKPDNYHITLKFMGEMEHLESNVVMQEKLQEVIRQSSSRYDLLNLTFGERLTIMGRKKAPMLAVPVVGATPEYDTALRQIKASIDRRLEHLDFLPDERDFMPHISLGRLYHIPAKMIQMPVPTVHAEGRKLWSIRPWADLWLFKSELDTTEGGGIFTPLANGYWPME